MENPALGKYSHIWFSSTRRFSRIFLRNCGGMIGGSEEVECCRFQRYLNTFFDVETIFGVFTHHVPEPQLSVYLFHPRKRELVGKKIGSPGSPPILPLPFPLIFHGPPGFSTDVVHWVSRTVFGVPVFPVTVLCFGGDDFSPLASSGFSKVISCFLLPFSRCTHKKNPCHCHAP